VAFGEGIVFKRYSVVDKSLHEVVEEISKLAHEKAAKQLRDHRMGVGMIVLGGDYSHVTLTVRDRSLFDLINVVCISSGATWTIASEAIMIQPPRSKRPDLPSTAFEASDRYSRFLAPGSDDVDCFDHVFHYGNSVVIESYGFEPMHFTQIIEEITELSVDFAPAELPHDRRGVGATVMNSEDYDPEISFSVRDANLWDIVNTACVEADYWWTISSCRLLLLPQREAQD